MSSITIEEAQSHLSEIINALVPGEEVVILRNQEPVAKLVSEHVKEKKRRQPGCLKDTILLIADDFDAPLEDFKEYME
jgi:antitoxin (DNA-binding transcriptional repressor) of toxin-antitoxin stability system